MKWGRKGRGTKELVGRVEYLGGRRRRRLPVDSVPGILHLSCKIGGLQREKSGNGGEGRAFLLFLSRFYFPDSSG